ncbi:Gp138 family membrane-puncturing spike protein [Lacticaseibacillus saniviri]
MSTNRDEFTEFFREFATQLAINFNVAQLARVVSLNGDRSKADVQPMVLNQSGSKRGMLLNVPVTRHLQQKIRLEGESSYLDQIKKGDVAIVVFLDRSIENWSGGNGDFKLGSLRMHNVNDAVIVGVL